MVFQDAMTSLNPVLRVETQMTEILKAHQKLEKKTRIDLARNALVQMGISEPNKRLKSYPHQLSGGMRQRVVIAISMLNNPEILIADEPTTALDVSIQSQILYKTQNLCREMETGVLWITHDLSVVAGLADEVSVMYAGKIVEHGNVDDVIDHPLHPYTVGLIAAVPSRTLRGRRLVQIPGMQMSPINLPAGCAFRERCQRADRLCKSDPELSMPVQGHQVRCFHPHMT
jgi:peptide/nickel transport system ATP-binding protein